MALSLADKLRQAAAVRMAQTAGETSARLNDMDAKAGMQNLPSKRSPKPPAVLPHAETPASDTQIEQDKRAGNFTHASAAGRSAGPNGGPKNLARLFRPLRLTRVQLW